MFCGNQVSKERLGYPTQKPEALLERIIKASSDQGDVSLKAYLTAQGDDVAVKTTEYYIAFRRMKNYVTVEFRTQANKLLVYAKVGPATVHLEPGFTRNVAKIGHFGSGDLEITLAGLQDLERAKPMFDRAYDES